MTGGDGEHPRHRFKRRLDELFELTGLTNDRVATLADESVRARRVRGVTAEDYKEPRRIDARRISEWRHSTAPAVPQRWMQLAAVLTVLIERAQRRAGGPVELYDIAAWRRLYEEALKSNRPAEAAEPSPLQANGVIRVGNLDQATVHHEYGAGGSDASRRPFSVIKPAQGKPDWRMLLDGSTLPPIFGLVGGMLERTLFIEGVSYDATAALAWLAGNHGRTLFLGGSRGDGRTSYLNALAARSLGSHTFVRWDREMPFSMQVAEDLAPEIQHADPTGLRTVVVVYSVDRDSDSLDQLSVELVAGTQLDDRRTVVIFEGDDGTLEQLPFYTAHRANLLPPGRESVQPWVSLLRRAYDEISRDGADERQILARYPNLTQFLGSSFAEQTSILADPESPMIVRLLRAVYGADMWGRLYNELRMLNPPAPDAMCYLQVCLATIANRGLPTYVVEELQPDAQWEIRSLGDPWVRGEDDEHFARHRVIAQVVLETAAKTSRGRLIRLAMLDYTSHLRTVKCGLLVRQIVMTVADLPSVALAGDTSELRKAVFYGVRRGLQTVDGVAGAIVGQCGRDYRKLAEWMKVLRLLIPVQSRDESHLWLIDLHEDLLEAATGTANPPNPHLLMYYFWKIRWLRAWLLAEDDYDFLNNAVREVAHFIGESWCRGDFYADLFRCCFQATRIRRTEILTGHEAIDGRFLYGTLFTAYERLRSLTTEARTRDIRRDFNMMFFRYVHWQLPDDAMDLVEQTWETSVALGCPDPQAGTLLAEMQLAGRAATPPDDAAVASASRALATVLDAFPSYGEALLVLALAHTRYGVQVDALSDRVAAAALAGGSDLNHAFLTHAAALIEPDAPDRRRLLFDAVTGYIRFIEAEGAGGYPADRLRFACDLAFTDLAHFGGPDVEQARRRYRRLASLAVEN